MDEDAQDERGSDLDGGTLVTSTPSEWLAYWFDQYNRAFFDGRLPTPDHFGLVPFGRRGRVMTANPNQSGAVSALGDARSGDAQVVLELRDLAGQTLEQDGLWTANLLHEMLHIRIGLRHGACTKRSKRWVRACDELGRKPGLVAELISSQ